MNKNTRSITTTKTSTVLYDTNGKIISQVKVKEVKRTREHEDDSPKPDLLKSILDTFLEEKKEVRRPVRRDTHKHPFEGIINMMEDGEMASAFPFMFTSRPNIIKPKTESEK